MTTHESGCIFCRENVKERIVEETATVMAIRDGYPVTEGHLLIVPKRHAGNYFDLTEAERNDIHCMLERMYRKTLETDPTVTGFNIGVNIGESAGQSVFHVHIHLIPRRDGDTENPKGGVRGVIPGKRGY